MCDVPCCLQSLSQAWLQLLLLYFHLACIYYIVISVCYVFVLLFLFYTFMIPIHGIRIIIHPSNDSLPDTLTPHTPHLHTRLSLRVKESGFITMDVVSLGFPSCVQWVRNNVSWKIVRYWTWNERRRVVIYLQRVPLNFDPLTTRLGSAIAQSVQLLRYGLEDQGIRVRFPAEARIFFSKASRLVLGPA
jgi:hypothetical protein